MLGTIPQIGYGTWKRTGDDCVACVATALELGYRHIDTAEGYGNEVEVGRGIALSGVPRGEIWVTTKVAPENLAPGAVRPHVEASLERLGLDRVDLLLVHWPAIGDRYEMSEYMRQFMAVRAAGLTRFIGVSNFTIRHVDLAMQILGEAPLVNQVELHPYLTNTPIVDHCRTKGLTLTAYSPLARGEVSDDPVLNGIGTEIGASGGQVALAWLMAKGYVVIPTSSKRANIAENLGAADITLTPEQIAAIDGLNRNERLVSGSFSPDWDTD
ncbi:aldo/keto reductase [Roseisalinus antarcticus]|uniref:2,5-diketo-D-gluconic acid reductase B n=1 Tax=Roseisalinus antarcticus TaxID=254357 RepID=A0A1Y5RPE2_9RHOB|nr:aldo/keto reductase [Roseisalinus antarcticus]SLN22293.1 2,5-diketo-D-gluconic acid reductase B [Roseisalinus antarcticus]